MSCDIVSRVHRGLASAGMLLVGVCLALVLTVGSSNGAGRRSTTKAPSVAEVSGVLGIVGGTLLRHPSPCGCLAEPGTVRFTSSSGDRTEVKTSRSGRFTVRLGARVGGATIKPPPS